MLLAANVLNALHAKSQLTISSTGKTCIRLPISLTPLFPYIMYLHLPCFHSHLPIISCSLFSPYHITPCYFIPRLLIPRLLIPHLLHLLHPLLLILHRSTFHRFTSHRFVPFRTTPCCFFHLLHRHILHKPYFTTLSIHSFIYSVLL